MNLRVHYFGVVYFLFWGCSPGQEDPTNQPSRPLNPLVVICSSFWDCDSKTAAVSPPVPEPNPPVADPLPETAESPPPPVTLPEEPAVLEPKVPGPVVIEESPSTEDPPIVSSPESEVSSEPPPPPPPETEPEVTPEPEVVKEEVIEKPKVIVEEPNDFTDRFLGPDDEAKITYGTNGGFGSHLFPQIVYGMPWTGGKDVVALGGGGSLLIKLNGFLVADGEGVDFTIFENPAHSKKLNAVFAERAKVSVSQDGEKFYEYPCDVDNAADFYPGCAGVGEVFALQDPSDPTVSGGDHYDLAEMGLPWIQYIRIEDLDTCQPGDPTYETQQFKTLCKGPGIQGFDLDAMAIVNGVKELTIIKQ